MRLHFTRKQCEVILEGIDTIDIVSKDELEIVETIKANIPLAELEQP